MHTLTDRVGRVFGCPYLTQDVKWPKLCKANLFQADLRKVDLKGADLEGASLADSDLFSAGLQGARLHDTNLVRANLYGANLTNSNLTKASLLYANIIRANLCGAILTKAELPEHPLNILRASPDWVYAYKFVTKNMLSPIHALKIIYEVGKTYKEPNACCDERILCGPGLHVATKEWILHNKYDPCIVYLVKFRASDIAAIPYATDGKFRVKKLIVVKKVKL